MRTKTMLLILVLFLAAACANRGTPPKLIPAHRYGDEKRTCEELLAMVQECKSTIEALHAGYQGRRTREKLSGVFWPVMFSVNPQADELSEIDAWIERHKVLMEVSKDQACDWRNDTYLMSELSVDDLGTDELRAQEAKRKAAAEKIKAESMIDYGE